MATPRPTTALPAFIATTTHPVALQVISLTGELWSGDVREVRLPGSQGEFGVMAQHAPLLSTLREGMLTIHPVAEAHPMHIYVSGGYVEVQPGRVIVLADLALRSDNLDAARAQTARDAAASPMAAAFTDMAYARLHAQLVHDRTVILERRRWR